MRSAGLAEAEDLGAARDELAGRRELAENTRQIVVDVRFVVRLVTVGVCEWGEGVAVRGGVQCEARAASLAATSPHSQVREEFGAHFDGRVALLQLFRLLARRRGLDGLRASAHGIGEGQGRAADAPGPRRV